MSKENYANLIKVYNTLQLIETKGENTVIMGECLKALGSLIQAVDKDMNITNTKENTYLIFAINKNLLSHQRY